MQERKNSEARIKANNRYNDKAYDRINLAVPKGHKATIQQAAEKAGQSINAFATTAIDERITKINEQKASREQP